MAESTGSRLTSDDDFWDTKPAKCQTCDNNMGGVSIWCHPGHVFRFIHHVREGDRLELIKSNLPHMHFWAIYCSFDRLDPLRLSAVQFFNHANEEWEAYSKGNNFLNVSLPASNHVSVSTILFFFKDTKVRINNSKDKDWSPLGTRHISKEVTYQLKELQENDLFFEEVYACRNQFKDSEDFVNYCRYDRDYQHNYRRDNNYKRISKWYSKTNIEGFIREVHVGDRLEFRGRTPHERWGIYIGQWGDDLEQVVLFAHGDKINSVSSIRLKVKPKLWVKSIRIHVVDGCYQVRINNGDDQKWLPLDRENILKEISRHLSGRAGTHYECKVLFKDSEGFVNYCRYDDWRINFGLVSDWCDSPYLLPRLRVGDRLEFNRTARPYMHWGIFVGAWELWRFQAVVHFAPADGNGKIFLKKKSSGSGSSAKDKPVLCMDSIQEVSKKDKVRINNKGDHNWPPFDRTYIFDEIMSQLKSQSDGDKPVYRIFSNNCEHFVNHCRYGEHHSDQISRFSRIRDRLMKGH